jgi:NTP pyrophosphatase (non-canonical NTP hydrolase)
MDENYVSPIMDFHRMKIVKNEDGSASIDSELTTLEKPIKINDLVLTSHLIAIDKGFWEDATDAEENELRYNNMIGNKLMLITSEISECQDALRSGEPASKVAEELADAMIRICDLVGYLGYDIEHVIFEKTERNKTRPRKHGKKF